MVACPMATIRSAVPDDLPELVDLYNHYILHTPITFDVEPHTLEQRRPWFEEHSAGGRYQLLVAQNAAGSLLGYASTSQWRPKAAYDPTVESSIYVRHDAIGRGIGREL